jgi:hypothetical protein
MRDSTVLIYDLTRTLPGRVVQQLSKEELDARWIDLTATDAVRAYKAVASLSAAPGQALPFLRDRLQPIAAADAGKVKQWLADLDSERVQVRETATKELENLGSRVEAALYKAIKDSASPEARTRLEQLYSRLPLAPDTLRTHRAILVLERIGSREARGVLETLVSGASGVRETEEARTALERLAGRLAPR